MYNVYRDNLNGFSDFAVTQHNATIVGLNETQSDFPFAVYPSITSGSVYVLVDVRLEGSAWSLTDVYGNAVLKGKLSTEKSTVDLSSLAAGVYLLRLDDHKEEMVKVVKY